MESLNRLREYQLEIVKILNHPQFQFLDHYHFSRARALERTGLIANAVQFHNYLTNINRRPEPGSFLYAPGSRMSDHHFYPGGRALETEKQQHH